MPVVQNVKRYMIVREVRDWGLLDECIQEEFRMGVHPLTTFKGQRGFSTRSSQNLPLSDYLGYTRLPLPRDSEDFQLDCAVQNPLSMAEFCNLIK